MANSLEVNIDRREIIRALGAYSDDELLELKQEFKDKCAGNIHLAQESEVGRSSTGLLLTNPIITLDCIMQVLNQRGKLTGVERRNWRLSRPRTHYKLVMNPLRNL